MIKIFLVDDYLFVRTGITRILESDPEITITGEASSYEELNKKIYSTPVDLLILDIELPDKSGLDILTEVKKTLPNLKVLILSIHKENEIIKKALSNGTDGYLNKGSAAEELLYAVKSINDGYFYLGKSIDPKSFST